MSPAIQTRSGERQATSTRRDSFSSEESGSSKNSTDTRPSTTEISDTEKEPEVPPPDTLLSEDPFSTEASEILFKSIDELQKVGVGQVLELPQLVIVGKQSAGKSSLLQSLTDIPFPVDESLCTRFATRIVSQRTPQGSRETITASIEDGDSDIFGYRPDPHRVTAFKRNPTSLAAEPFKKLIGEAKDVMGINPSGKVQGQNFSSMVLRIELAGPHRSNFAILDIPGTFSNAINNVKKHEIAGVKALATSYMRGKENMIICVADATDDLSNQEIFTLAGEVLAEEAANGSVDSSRFVGVFAKCDITKRSKSVVRSVLQQEGIMKHHLSWYVVQNRGQDAAPDFDRKAAELETFSKEPWLQIPPRQRGTAALRSYLAKSLSQRIRAAFPNMQDKVRELLQKERARRETFGEARPNYEQRRVYLRHITSQFETLAWKSLYSPSDLPTNELNLKGPTQRENDNFTKTMTGVGHLYEFLEIGKELPANYDQGSTTFGGSLEISSHPNTPTRNPESTPSSTLTPGAKENIRPKAAHELYYQIKQHIDNYRAEELPGVLNPAVLKPLWKMQTSKWQQLGEAHLIKIIETTRSFAHNIFDHVAASQALPERAKRALKAIIDTFSETAKAESLIALRTLCKRHATKPLYTSDPKYLLNVRESQRLRFFQAIDRYTILYPSLNFIKEAESAPSPQITEASNGWAVVDLAHLDSLFDQIHPNGARTQNTQDEVHDILKAYYDITLQNFLYDINTNIVEPFLSSPIGPLFGLNTDYILSLSASEIDDLGGEDEKTLVGRQNCDYQIAKLERAMGIADDAWRKTRELSV